MARGDVRDLQLATLIADETALILETAEDPQLGAFEVVRVTPRNGGRHFTVTLRPKSGKIDAAALRRLLPKVQGYVRYELGMSLNLKRVPGISLMLDR